VGKFIWKTGRGNKEEVERFKKKERVKPTKRGEKKKGNGEIDKKEREYKSPCGKSRGKGKVHPLGNRKLGEIITKGGQTIKA